MDWEQIEKDFKEFETEFCKETNNYKLVTNWFKQRIESEQLPQPPEKLNEEERNEFHNRTDVTADIKAVYERKT